ncbi:MULTISPECIES: hypothetical protein [unclassified Brevibacterium]|nr:hypothetical protein [Brevibacterium sp. S22]
MIDVRRARSPVSPRARRRVDRGREYGALPDGVDIDVLVERA